VEVELTNRAIKQYGKLNEPDLNRITKAIDGLEEEPPVGDIVKLTDKNNKYRLRVGGYRVLYKKTDGRIVVTGIELRGQAYKKR
jgi:mRNA interferase RelE/StbE